MTSRPSRARAYAPDPAAPGNQPCAHPGCTGEGLYRAPKSRQEVRSYQWLCLDHVRQFNAAWDFYKGMSPGEIEAHLRDDTHWQRPTWPLGQNGAVNADGSLFGENLVSAARQKKPAQNGVPPTLLQPLSDFGLDWPVTLAQVKTRYKELAKLHHPDANGGDKAAEERLKNINLAYAALRAHLSLEPAVPHGLGSCGN
jgi:hypothetical protein